MNSNVSKFKKLGRVGIWVGSIILLLLLSGTLFLNWYVPIVLRNKINHLVVDGSDGLYKCSMTNVSVNLWLGKVTFKGVNISIDSTKYKQLKQDGKLPNMTFEMKMTEGSVAGLNVFRLIFSKEVSAGTIQVDNANITLCRQHREKKKSTPTDKPAPTEESLWKTIKPHINGIYVKNVLLNKTKFTYRESENKKEISFGYQDCSVKLHNIRIDSIGASNPSRILFTEDIAIKVAGMNYFTPDSLYNLRIDSLSYSSYYRQVNMKNFTLNPTLSLVEFTKKHGMQVDVFEAGIPKMVAINFKIDRIFTDNELCFDTIYLKNPIIKINRDRDAHFDTTSQYGKYPNEALANAPITIRIPLVLLDEAEIHYVERQRLTHKIGDAFFTKVTGSISNITNSAEDIEKENHCKFDLDGFFLHHGKLHVKLDFDLASPMGNYSSAVDMGPVSIKELNSVFIPFGNVSVKTMNMYESHVDFEANRDGITGNARLIYDDLSIEILKPDPKTHKTKKQGVMSFFANIFGVRAHNIIGKKEVMATNLHVDRKRRQPFANLIWEFLFESLKKIILKVPMPELKVEM